MIFLCRVCWSYCYNDIESVECRRVEGVAYLDFGRNPLELVESDKFLYSGTTGFRIRFSTAIDFICWAGYLIRYPGLLG